MRIGLLQIIATLLVATTTPLLCSAQGLTEAQQRQRLEQYKRELDRVKGEVEDLKREKSSASRQVAALDREMKMRNDYISEIEAERRGVEADIEAMDRHIDSLTGVLEHNRAMYAEAVRIAHRNYRQHSSTNYLFSASTLHEAARRMAEIEHIAVSREQLATNIIEQRSAIDHERALLDIRHGELDSIYEVLASERRALADSRTEAQRAYNRLSRREKDAINEQRRQQRLHDDAVAELQRLLKGNRVGAGFSRDTRGLNLPVEGGVLTQEGFGATITGKRGDAVRTIHEGIVQDIQYKRLTNRYTIFLGYNEYLVTYTNLGSVSVKKGDVVKKDQVIGTIGNGIDASDKPFIRLAIYDCDSRKALYVSDFFKKL
jgi:septal ring factor EnvC (AmiA/AmiB activator)